MRVSVYVEGESDKLALAALWEDWRRRLGEAGHGIRIYALGGKPTFLRKIGRHAAQMLCAGEKDLSNPNRNVRYLTKIEMSGFLACRLT